MSTLMAGMKRGTYFIPEVGDEVLVAFEQGEVHRPLCIGVMWNGQDPSPHTNADGKNDIRLIKSRSGHKLIFDDKDGAERITFVDKTGKNRIVWEVKDKTITVQSLEGSIGFKAPKGTLTVNVATLDVKTTSETVMHSDKTAAFQSAGKMEWAGGGDITVSASLLNINVSGPAGSGGNASGGNGQQGAAEDGSGGAGAKKEEEKKKDEAAEEKKTEPPPVVVAAAWGTAVVTLGAAGKALLSASVGNIPDGASATFDIKSRDGQSMGTVSGTVSGGRAKAEWEPKLPPGGAPEFEFEVTCQGKSSKSGIMKMVTWVDLTITDPDGKVLPGAEYDLVFDDGSKKSGKADADGHARHEGVYPGKVKGVRVFWKEGMKPGAGGDGAGAGAGAGAEGAAGADAAADDDADVHVLAMIVKTIGDSLLLSHPVKILDPDTGKVVAEAETDDKGVVHAEVPEDKKYRVEIVDEKIDIPDPPPPISQDVKATLVCQFVDAAGKPIAAEDVILVGSGGDPDTTLHTDENGKILVSASLGPHDLKLRDKKFTAHALPSADSAQDANLYLFMVT